MSDSERSQFKFSTYGSNDHVMFNMASGDVRYNRVFKNYNLRFPSGIVYIADGIVASSGWSISRAYYLAYRHNGFDRLPDERTIKPRLSASANVLYADLHAANISFSSFWAAGNNSYDALQFAFGRVEDERCDTTKMPHSILLK